MARFPRSSVGRRIFTADFRREQIGRVLRGEMTVAELSRRAERDALKSLRLARGVSRR